MKRILLAFVAAFVCGMAFSQVITKQDIDSYINRAGKSWTATAQELGDKYKLNDNGELTMSIVKECPGQSKSLSYKKIFNWIISMSADAKSAIQIANESEGTIQTRCNLPNIAKRGFLSEDGYFVSIRPLLTFDFKDNKVRFTFTLQCYNVLKREDDGSFGFGLGGDMFMTSGGGIRTDELVWALKDCFPYAPKNGSHPKITSSKGLVSTVSCYNILVDKMTEALQKPLKEKNNNW